MEKAENGSSGIAGVWEHPPSFYCPIAQSCMRDPVVLSDGHSYERRHIERWLEHHNTSPVAGTKLQHKVVFPNHALRNAIEEYFQQVFSGHRRAIRKSISGTGLGSGASLVRTIDALMQCSLLVSADLSTECVLRQIMDEAKLLLKAEVASVFLVDAQRQELYSTVNSTRGELRIPISVGIAGHVASTGEVAVIPDAYTDPRFNRALDAQTGFRTHNIVCAPLKTKKGKVVGVVQIINKLRTNSQGDHEIAADGVANFTPDDVSFLRVFAAQAAAAIVNSETDAIDHKGQLPLEGQRHGPDARINCWSRVSSWFSGLEPPRRCEGEGGVPDAAEPLRKTSTVAEPSSCTQELLRFGFSGWQMDTFSLADATGNRPLSTLCTYLFEKHGFRESFGCDTSKVENFFIEIERGYSETVPYHNRAHAASVVHIMHSILLHTGFAKVAAATLDPAGNSDGQLELMACLLAAAVHDYEHKGLSNDFLVKTRDMRAVRYNDKHVNENHHVAAAFAVLARPENNFLDCLDQAAFNRLRDLVIDLVICTDMATNSQMLASFTAALDKAAARDPSSQTFDSTQGVAEAAFVPSTREEAILLLQIALKCADIGHLAVSWDLHIRWVKRLEQEFFAQGDQERQLGLPISFLMDRTKPGVSQTQVGFFNFVVQPLFRSMARASPVAEPLLLAVMANGDQWRSMEATPEKQKSDSDARASETVPAESADGCCDKAEDEGAWRSERSRIAI